MVFRNPHAGAGAANAVRHDPRVMSFDDATALQSDAGPFGWNVPDGWQQGRGSWGGLPIGAMVRAVELTQADPTRPVRAVTAHLAAPALVGPHRISVAPVRIGSAVSTWEARLLAHDGDVVATAVVVTGAPRRPAQGRDESAWSPLTMPDAPPADAVPVAETPPPFPPFTRHVEFRVLRGLPLQGGTAETLGWVGYRTDVPWTAASTVALVDAWYSVTLVALAELGPIATITFAATLLVDPATLPPGARLLHHGLVGAARDGYASEQRRLWAPDGRLVVDNLQTIAVG